MRTSSAIRGPGSGAGQRSSARGAPGIGDRSVRIYRRSARAGASAQGSPRRLRDPDPRGSAHLCRFHRWARPLARPVVPAAGRNSRGRSAGGSGGLDRTGGRAPRSWPPPGGFAWTDARVAGRHRPSGDVLFDSIAAAAGETGVALVLSGMGRDGAAGAAAVAPRRRPRDRAGPGVVRGLRDAAGCGRLRSRPGAVSRRDRCLPAGLRSSRSGPDDVTMSLALSRGTRPPGDRDHVGGRQGEGAARRAAPRRAGT